MNGSDVLDNTQSVQEDEYEFPYHYLPIADDRGFSWFPYWSWGYKYLTGIDVVLKELSSLKFDSLIDVGCGDGRFIREVKAGYQGKKLVGVDYSDRAIRLANSLNPNSDYRAEDITADALDEKFDVMTMIEVLEHIPPDHIDEFVKHLGKLMHKDSTFIMTVPHKNQELIPKHYQHFDSVLLQKTFGEYFDIDHMFYFDSKSKLVSWVQRLIFNRFYIVRHQGLLNILYRRYRESYLYCDESRCQRIGAVMRLK